MGHKYDYEHWRLAKIWAALRAMAIEDFPEIDERCRREVFLRAGLICRQALAALGLPAALKSQTARHLPPGKAGGRQPDG